MRGTIVVALGAGTLLLAVGLATTGGCLRSTQFSCSTDTQCVNSGVQGECEMVGFCSFPDGACQSGRRFGELEGPQSNQCVDEQTPDAGPPPPDAYVHDARECFGSAGYELCFAMMPPMGTVTLSGDLDTTSDARCVAMPASWATAGHPDACMVIGREINVTALLKVTGTRPLVLVGDSVSITAVIDIASHVAGATAAGANATQCAPFATPAGNDAGGGAGGAGGSFMTVGGNGGNGQAAATGGTAAAADAAAPTVLRGGCPGQVGGINVEAAGAPGAGGGAIYIAAGRFSMSSAGAINASGAGAAGGGDDSGGSGGGTGGMIVIHAVELGATTGGKLVANGGGGASGADSNTNGAPGFDPSVGTIMTPAPGGSAGGTGANGGAGFAGTTAAKIGSNAATQEAGGGGGGGGGYIRVNVALPGVTASPAATVVP